MSRWLNTTCLSSLTDATRLPEAWLLSWDQHKLQSNLRILGTTIQQAFKVSSPMDLAYKGWYAWSVLQCCLSNTNKDVQYPQLTNQSTKARRPTNVCGFSSQEVTNRMANVWLQHQHSLQSPGRLHHDGVPRKTSRSIGSWMVSNITTFIGYHWKIPDILTFIRCIIFGFQYARHSWKIKTHEIVTLTIRPFFSLNPYVDVSKVGTLKATEIWLIEKT